MHDSPQKLSRKHVSSVCFLAVFLTRKRGEKKMPTVVQISVWPVEPRVQSVTCGVSLGFAAAPGRTDQLMEGELQGVCGCQSQRFVCFMIVLLQAFRVQDCR